MALLLARLEEGDQFGEELRNRQSPSCDTYLIAPTSSLLRCDDILAIVDWGGARCRQVRREVGTSEDVGSAIHMPPRRHL